MRRLTKRELLFAEVVVFARQAMFECPDQVMLEDFRRKFGVPAAPLVMIEKRINPQPELEPFHYVGGGKELSRIEFYAQTNDAAFVVGVDNEDEIRVEITDGEIGVPYDHAPWDND